MASSVCVFTLYAFHSRLSQSPSVVSCLSWHDWSLACLLKSCWTGMPADVLFWLRIRAALMSTRAHAEILSAVSWWHLTNRSAKRWVSLGMRPTTEYTRLVLICSFSYHFQFGCAKECVNEVILAPEVQCQLDAIVIGIPPFSRTNKDISPLLHFQMLPVNQTRAPERGRLIENNSWV